MSKRHLGVVATGAAAIALVAPNAAVHAGTSFASANDGDEVVPRPPESSSEAASPTHASPEPASPNQASAERTSAEPASLDFGDLDQGPPPEIGWFADGAFHMGDQRWEFGADPVDRFVEVEDGFLASTNSNGIHQRQLTHVDRDGHAEVIAEGALSAPVAAQGGELVAWTEYETDARDAPTSSTVHVADSSGTVLASLDTFDALPVGFVNDHLVINDRDKDGSAVLLFDYTRGQADELDQYDKAWAVEDSRGLLSVTGTDKGEPYSAVVNPASHDPTELWRSDERRVDSFSREGTFAATVDIRTDGLGPNEFMVTDASDGEQVFGTDAELIHNLTWESDGSVIFEAWSQGEQALVRCVEADRGCELATEAAPAGEPEDIANAPYRLATD